MPPKSVKKEMTDAEFEAELVEGLDKSIDEDDIEEGTIIAEKVFGVEKPTLEMILGCHRRVFCYDDESTQDIVVDELIESFAAAKAMAAFSSKPEPWEVFWVYDEVFNDEGGEDDNEDDDE